MQIDVAGSAAGTQSPGSESRLQVVAVGLRWDPVGRGKPAATQHADLDVSCIVMDDRRNPIEIVHPGRTRNADASVVHTGDSRTGAGEWDDERIFVFLHALPETVSALTFVVTSVAGRRFDEIPNASCHITDEGTEQELLRVNLTGLGAQTAHCVATLLRTPTGWEVSPGAASDTQTKALVEMLLQTAGGKSCG